VKTTYSDLELRALELYASLLPLIKRKLEAKTAEDRQAITQAILHEIVTALEHPRVETDSHGDSHVASR